MYVFIHIYLPTWLVHRTMCPYRWDKDTAEPVGKVNNIGCRKVGP